MINFYYETEFILEPESRYAKWIEEVIRSHEYQLGEVSYIFCNDDYLNRINIEFLNHDTLTDIISFDETLGNEVSGEIYISVERVKENAIIYEVEFGNELKRVMAHGILHYCGYSDKNEKEALVMRTEEDRALELIII